MPQAKVSPADAHASSLGECLDAMRRYAQGSGGVQKDLRKARELGQQAIAIASGTSIAPTNSEPFKTLYDRACNGDADASVKVACLYARGNSEVFQSMIDSQIWMNHAIGFYAGTEIPPGLVRQKKAEEPPAVNRTNRPKRKRKRKPIHLEVPSFVYSISNGLSWVAGIIGALYIISPIDIVPDAIPVVGWTDDIGVGVGTLVVILVLRFFPKILELLTNILNALNRIINLTVMTVLLLAAILGILIYKYIIV